MRQCLKTATVLFCLGIAGCSKGASDHTAQAPATSAPAAGSAKPPPPVSPPLQSPPADPAQTINQAVYDPASSSPASQDKTAPANPALIKAQVLLDRSRFSPGVVDGRWGGNFAHALSAFQGFHRLAPTGRLDQVTWEALSQDKRPVAGVYNLTAEDVAGPFAPDVGEDFVKLAALQQGPLYARPSEMLAERFHMQEALLKALNPSTDFSRVGAAVVITLAGAPGFDKGVVERVEVSKSRAQVIAFDRNAHVLAVYPATVGSTERPSPSGVHKIVGVAWNPDYTYDPAKLKWGPRSHGKLHIKPGPNGPVGAVWIDLNAPSYGLHGTPDPDKIGKTASHGCVRMTNWDAIALAHGVKPGVTVVFVGARP